MVRRASSYYHNRIHTYNVSVVGTRTTCTWLTGRSTITTSAAITTTTTSTTRVVTTETITQTATTTLAPVMARAANIAAAAEDIIASVVESGTTTNDVAESTKNSQRVAAEQGLSTACSCKLVDPTSTITKSYALPPVVSSPSSCVCHMTDQTSTPPLATESLLWMR